MAYLTDTTDASAEGALIPRLQHSTWKRWIPAVLAGAALIYFVVIACNWPFTQKRIVHELEQRSLRTVTVGQFHRTYFPPGCVVEDIRFLHRKHKEKMPLIRVRQLVLVTTYAKILTLQEHLSVVRVVDMHVTVPPSIPGQPNPVMPLTYSTSKPSIKIDRIVADGAVLEFVTKTGEKRYRLGIDKLTLDGVGNNVPMSYRTSISIEKPPGKIHSSGTFGVWNPKDPGSTLLHGDYTFENANLAAFHGISGTLSSGGKFRGILRQIAIEGRADVPDFKVYDTSHERRLQAAYRAIVDATNGDTKLEQVAATFDHTTAEFRGTIAKSDNRAGKTASIDIWTDSARLEDILRLFISGQNAPMSGVFALSAHVDIPTGPEPFLQRIRMSADFGVSRGKFANADTERELTRLSESAQKAEKDDAEQPGRNVVSDLKGHGDAVSGVARLSDVSFTIPGAKAWMHGTYGLIDYKVDLHGTLLTTGSPSSATTGFKSLMVKVITPFFKRKHKQKMVPFKITGSYSKLDTSLDLGQAHGDPEVKSSGR
ncbi:MAG TPA: AsmA-like C-terminal region-containing protein [Bryobacteraceae bacterium]|jgi:hypothetical protein|nr:AsmA-like C-terminal region-containing protein [Bryobacteraceae bacterium]